MTLAADNCRVFKHRCEDSTDCPHRVLLRSAARFASDWKIDASGQDSPRLSCHRGRI